MNDTNRSYRIRTEVGSNVNINVNLDQDYNTFEILSLKLTQEDAYRLQSADYGVIVGRVLANGGFGIPNTKISVFISATTETRMDVLKAQLYPYQSTQDRGDKGIRYNLLPDQDLSDCHRAVGTFPSKTFVLDNDDVIEIFEEYYKYTTKTNNAGDYMICGVPTGDYTVHMDLDLSDCGVLSQRPRDFYYKGYTVEQFENPNVFRSDDELDALSQIFSQDQTVEVIPFWGNTGQGDQVGISRCDINVNYKFEPTCVFLGSVFTDNSSNGISKRCIPTNVMGAMDELVTGEGTIEMIRKTPNNTIEEFAIKGTELINSDGIWCYQIPMNLDYITTDEYGNTVATNNPDKGIPTRASVRFRISLHDNDQNTENYFLSKVLVPNNPKDETETDFNFGTQTKDTSFRDMFWNNVYSVKSYIPRIQQSQRIKTERFSGIKGANHYGNNNPIPYNNLRIRLPLMFIMLCAIIKTYITVVGFVNKVIDALCLGLTRISNAVVLNTHVFSKKRRNWLFSWIEKQSLVVLHGDLCPDLEGWYFAPFERPDANRHIDGAGTWDLFKYTYRDLKDKNSSTSDVSGDDDDGSDSKIIATATVYKDETSIDYTNSDYVPNGEKEPICLTRNVDYLLSCVEMNLAEEYRVINFDFYNDWLNGTIYLPRWNKFVRKKRQYLWGLIKVPLKIKGCLSSSNTGNGSVSFGRLRRYVQQCALRYENVTSTGRTVGTQIGCLPSENYTINGGQKVKNYQKCHKKAGLIQRTIFGSNGGIIKEKQTSKGQYVYYAKPCEWSSQVEWVSPTQAIIHPKRKVHFFSTDIILLGSLNDCDKNGIPQTFKGLVNTSYKMPTNLALTNYDDEGYMYGVKSGDTITICDKPEGISLETSKVAPIITAQTFSALTKFYEGVESITYQALDDYIALTEAPGISWNYSGPGQGEKTFGIASATTSYYNAWQPGGLFLGISCFNSETNIKSCVNLSRACEAGVATNPRREVVRGVNYNPITGSTFLFNYYVPTGTITRDDIIDEDMRSAFATLNQERLIATKLDAETGYLKYDFKYLKPSSFDGALSKYVSGTYNNSSKYYSGGMAISTFVVDENEVEVTIPGLDYDKDVKQHTFSRALEKFDSDYYKYRFGLSSLAEADTKYAYRDGSYFALPQYENSFYFYFGLHPGATALDEFNKQYFSSCEKNENVDESGFEYKQINESEVSGQTVLVYGSIPENPTNQYPKYIKVGDSYYVLKPVDEDTEPTVQISLQQISGLTEYHVGANSGWLYPEAHFEISGPSSYLKANTISTTSSGLTKISYLMPNITSARITSDGMATYKFQIDPYINPRQAFPSDASITIGVKGVSGVNIECTPINIKIMY